MSRSNRIPKSVLATLSILCALCIIVPTARADDERGLHPKIRTTPSVIIGRL
jgi:hypothetical protein